jgi:hypothetical protein
MFMFIGMRPKMWIHQMHDADNLTQKSADGNLARTKHKAKSFEIIRNSPDILKVAGAASHPTK